MPELLQMSLETNERVVGTSAVFLGVVPEASELRFAIDGQDHGIQIEGEGGSPSGQGEELSAQLIVQGDELTDGAGTHPLEESAPGRLVRKTGEAQPGQEGTVVLQNFCLVDPSPASHDGVQPCQDEIARVIIGAPPRWLHIVLEQPTQPELDKNRCKRTLPPK